MILLEGQQSLDLRPRLTQCDLIVPRLHLLRLSLQLGCNDALGLYLKVDLFGCMAQSRCGKCQKRLKDKQETENLLQTGQSVIQCTGAAQLESQHINRG